jgi:hypothetical protein
LGTNLFRQFKQDRRDHVRLRTGSFPDRTYFGGGSDSQAFFGAPLRKIDSDLKTVVIAMRPQNKPGFPGQEREIESGREEIARERSQKVVTKATIDEQRRKIGKLESDIQRHQGMIGREASELRN